MKELAKVNARLFAAANQCRAREDARYYLNGVLLVPKEKGCLMVSTDGHRMTVVYDEDGTVEKEILVRVDPLMEKQCKLRTATTLSFDDNYHCSLSARQSPRASRNTDAFRCSTPYEIIQGSFPNWRPVLTPTGTGAISFVQGNPSYIADIKALNDLTKGSSRTGITQIYLGYLERITFLINKIVWYVVLPMTNNGEDDFTTPEWIK